MTPLPTSSDRIALASPLRPFLPSTVEWRRYWNIIVYRTYAELKAEAQLNHMGYIWWLLEPLLNTVLFYLILVAVMEQGKAGASPSFSSPPSPGNGSAPACSIPPAPSLMPAVS
jgi:hypothetical protein